MKINMLEILVNIAEVFVTYIIILLCLVFIVFGLGKILKSVENMIHGKGGILDFIIVLMVVNKYIND